MARIVLSSGIDEDFERIFAFLFEHALDSTIERIGAIVAALDILESSPYIGRPTDNGKRELVISTGASGYVALYRYVPELDTVFVLAVKSQREAGYSGR